MKGVRGWGGGQNSSEGKTHTVSEEVGCEDRIERRERPRMFGGCEGGAERNPGTLKLN